MAKEDLIKHQYKKGESGNLSGRPKKSFASINAELKKEGFVPLRKSEMMEAYAMIFNTSEDRLKKLASDKETPYPLRMMITSLNNTKTRDSVLKDMRDWSFGKAQNSTDITSGGDVIESAPIQINFIKTKTDEE